MNFMGISSSQVDMLRNRLFNAVSSIAEDAGTYCLIQSFTVTRDSSGADINTYDTAPGLDAIPCQVKVDSSVESRYIQLTLGRTIYSIQLSGYYPQIHMSWRAVVGSTVFNIIGVKQDSLHVGTRLSCEVLELTES